MRLRVLLWTKVTCPPAHWTSHCLCFRAASRKGVWKMLLSGLQALLGATPGRAVLSRCLSHAYDCNCHCSAQVTLVKRFHIHKHVWFLFYICSGFVFCCCIFVHATIAATAWWLLLNSFCHLQLWQLLCEHSPDELTTFCFLPAFVWGLRHGLCIAFMSFHSSVCSALHPLGRVPRVWDTKLDW